MKKWIILFSIVSCIQVAKGQQGLVIGANFMPMSSNIINQNTWGNGREYDYLPTFRTSFGLDVGYNLTDHFGLYTGYWFTDLGQNYQDSYFDSEWDRKLTFKYNIIPIMAKFNGTGAKVNFLAGAGILLASLKEAKQEWLRDGSPYSEIINNPITSEPFDLGATDVTERFVDNDLMINLEMCARILCSEKLLLDVALNFAYGFKDINHEDWHIPNGSGVYDPSHNAFIGLRLGLAYVISGKSEPAAGTTEE